MALRTLILGALAGLTMGGACAAENLVSENTTLRPGVRYVSGVFPSSSYRLSVRLLDRGTALSTLLATPPCSGVAITGGFSDDASGPLEPEGLVIVDGKVRNRLEPRGDGGMLVGDGKTVRLHRLRDWRERSQAKTTSVLQSFPLLVWDGQVDEPLGNPKRANRVAIGETPTGFVLIGAFGRDNDAVSLREFAQDARRLFGPDLKRLLNLDGGPSAFIRTADRHWIPEDGAVRTYLCVEAR